MMNDFKIHCIALCKNEADVVQSCLLAAAEWADYIYVYDGKSADGTWDVVKGLNHPRIIPWKQEETVFRDGLRADVFEAFRHRSAPGDWWLQLNVDEFYQESPRLVLSRVPKSHHLVWGIMVEYVVTEKDAAEIDFSLPFAEIRPRLRYYYVSWSEPRAFRYRPGLVWKPDWAWPRHVGLVARERLVYLHYPSRSPRQMEVRWATRVPHRESGFKGWSEAVEQKRRTVQPTADLHFDDGKSPLRIDEAALPMHLEKPWHRAAKHVMHGLRIWA